MKFLQSALCSLLFAVLTAVQVESTGDYFVVTYFDNVPPYLQEEMMNRTQVTISYLEQFLLNCDWVDPGEEYVPGRDRQRNRALTVEDEDEELQAGEESVDEPSAAMDRELFSSCPSWCSNSGSKTCRARGCAFCGRCRRRQERKLSLVTARFMGDAGKPATAFPLGLCQSDCDRNSECGPGLICKQRTYGQVRNRFGSEADATSETQYLTPSSLSAYFNRCHYLCLAFHSATLRSLCPGLARAGVF
jgi:hypothetical protein